MFIPILVHTQNPEKEIHRLDLGGTYTLTLTVQPEWTLKQQNKVRGDTEINIVNSLNSREKCRIYILPLEKIPDDNGIKSLLAQNGDALLRKAVEKEFRFLPLGDKQGMYYLLTDAAPKEGEPRLISRGATRRPHHLVLFTILFNDKDAKFFTKMIGSLGQLRIEETATLSGDRRR